MKFDLNSIEHLKGNLFSDMMQVIISKKESNISDRFSVIEKLVYNQNIIHFGCCDHIPLIRQKIQNNTWLHSRLCKNSIKCLGVDINKEAITYIQNEFGCRDILHADLLIDEIDEIRNNHWDYMVMGEILEHVDNPTIFLNAIRLKYNGNIKKLIITVPNAFSWRNFKHAIQHKEVINTDHRYWFTPYTLAKIVVNAGLQVENFYFCEPFPVRNDWKSKLSIRTTLRKFVVRNYPALRGTIIMVVRL